MTGIMRVFRISIIVGIILSVSLVNATVRDSTNAADSEKPNPCLNCGTELINEDDPLLFLSTLDGTFIGVNHRSGKVVWKFKEEAAVKVPIESKHALMPTFLPDPKDGSLYMLNSDNPSDLKKLQFTIQQLVTSSPCRSADGIFYTGKKIDNWFTVDWRTGVKEELLNSEINDKVCPLLNRRLMFLGRTEYNLIIYDATRKERKWNITFYDYTAKVMPPDMVNNYEYMYISGSASGKFAMLKKAGDGPSLWQADFGSPVIGVYTRDGDGLIALPFTTMDDHSMHLFSAKFNKQQPIYTLYVGEHTHGFYALPSTAAAGSAVPMLNGPAVVDTISAEVKDGESSEFLGYYKMPDSGFDRLQIAGRTDPIIEMNGTFRKNSSFMKNMYDDGNSVAIQTDGTIDDIGGQQTESTFQYAYLYLMSLDNLEQKFPLVVMFITVGSMILVVLYVRAQVREFKQTSSSGFSRGSNANYGSVTAVAEELPNGTTRVGKILFDSNQILGKGCEGTFVFRGEFDDRQVAVKRLLPECFTVADREVCLLRESDQHPNVIRYFCMEQDKQFRYIALELCSATLQEYTEQGALREYVTATDVLAQAVSGLAHLHSLNIVHRDIKPHNVLLSYPSSNDNKVRTMISDFGLCKKLQTGRASFSRKSGITGTEGWIAPEIIHGKFRTTTSVDIFSMGCVFYYVLSDGKHPFGDSLSRQANIMNGDCKLDELKNDFYELWSHLIAKMVAVDPTERPSVNVIKKHPAFWSKDFTLSFLQDVSDRIEKEETNSYVLIELETGNGQVLKGDWRDMIEQEIADDLKKYRTYRPDSVRDLLRALRNKKHHYRELSPRVRNILGNTPEKYVEYWMTRFPKLVLHTWLAMQCVSREAIFHKYYCDSSYTFPRVHTGAVPVWLYNTLNASPRWKFPQVASATRSGGRRLSGAFFSVQNGGPGGKPPEYLWRQRPKATVDAVDSTTTVATTTTTTMDIRLSFGDGTELIEKAEEAEVDANVTGGEAEETTVEMTDVDGKSPAEGGAQRTTRRRRGKNKKKSTSTGENLSESNSETAESTNTANENEIDDTRTELEFEAREFERNGRAEEAQQVWKSLPLDAFFAKKTVDLRDDQEERNLSDVDNGERVDESKTDDTAWQSGTKHRQRVKHRNRRKSSDVPQLTVSFSMSAQ